MIYIVSYACSAREKRDEEVKDAFGFCFGTDCAMPDLCRSEKGRPYFETDEGMPPLYISLTDSGNYRMIAFSDSEIGIDLQECTIHGAKTEEQMPDRADAIARRFFHAEEYTWISGGNTSQEQMRRFFTVWTMREAFAKYRGTGFDGSFRSFDVTHDFPALHFDFPEVPEGYICCVCHGNEEQVTVTERPVP